MRRYVADLPMGLFSAAASARFTFVKLLACLLLSAAIVLSGCKEKPREGGALEYPVATAKLVSHVTSGIIPADGAVQATRSMPRAA